MIGRLKSLLPSWRRAQERDMREELESLAALAEPGELGNLTRVAEEARAEWSWIWLEQLIRDLRFAFRGLRHNPGFTATAVLSLALGIGANTAIFSLIDALMLRWLPVPQPQQLVQLKMQFPHSKEPAGDGFSYLIATTLAEQKDIFSGVAGFSAATFNVGVSGSVSSVHGDWVTGGYYQTLGLSPAIGRLLAPADDQRGAPLVAVISYGYWKRQFAADESVIGRTLTVNGAPVAVVGVSPRGFGGVNVGSVADITVAIAGLPQLAPSAAGLLGPGNIWLRILARPRQGLSLAQAEARLSMVWPRIADSVVSSTWPAARRQQIIGASFQLAPGGTGYSYLRELFSKPLLVLMALTALVLLIACANVASLLLARAHARQREISVRLAIGAGRGRIIRQLLTESTLLSALGATAGIWLAWLTSGFLVRTFPGVIFDLTPNWHVLAFTIAVALANGLLFGLAPALQTTAIGRFVAAKDGARAAGSRSRLLSSLVSAQVALSLLLLVGAGLFVRTLRNLVNTDPGFRREGILLVDLDGQREGYRDAALTAFYGDLLARVQHIPGVESAAISSHTPLSGATWSEAVAPQGQPLPQQDNALFIAAGPSFFATMGTPLISGREFEDGDRGSANVAIVNQSFAARYFPGRSPLGLYISATVSKPPSDLRIVGIASDVRTVSLRSRPQPMVYVSYFQTPPRFGALEIRAKGSLSEIAAAIRKELQPSFPKTPVEVRALTDQAERTLVQERLMANLAGGFGVLGLLLSCVGLYGLLAYSVVRRTREIGVRMALGAQQREVLWMVAKRALGLVAIGIVLGLPVAWLLSRTVKSMLFGLTATDPGILAAAVGLLAVAGLVAAYLPARRAARIDPMTALRHE